MPNLQSELRELDDAIAAQERLRGQVPDAILNTAITALRANRGAIAQGDSSLAVGERGVAVGGDNYGAINTGIIVNIHGDDIERNRGVARAVLAATLLAPPLESKRKKAIARYYRAIAKTLTEAAAALRGGIVPHGRCGEMLGYAHQLPAEIGDVVGAPQAQALSQKLLGSYQVESFGDQFMHLPKSERDAKFGVLDEAAGYFRAAARSLQVRR